MLSFFFLFQPSLAWQQKKKKITHAAYEKQKSVFFFLVPFFCWVLFLTFGVFALRFAASAVAVALGYLLQVSCRPHFLYRKGRHYYHFFFDACFRIAVLVPAFFSLGFSHLNLIWFFSHFWRYEALWDAVWRCVLFDPLLEGEHDASFRSYVDLVFLVFFFIGFKKQQRQEQRPLKWWTGRLEEEKPTAHGHEVSKREM